jgi:hypothetical protein
MKQGELEMVAMDPREREAKFEESKVASIEQTACRLAACVIAHQRGWSLNAAMSKVAAIREVLDPKWSILARELVGGEED